MPFLDPDAVAGVLAPRTVVDVEPLGGSWAPVARAVLDDGATVVVKERRRHGGGWGYDPANLRRERAALEVLAVIADDTIGPRFLGGDDEAGVVVMTDLGRGATLESLLLDPTSGAAARVGLVEHGRALGRLHAATASREIEAEYLARRSALDPSFDPMADRTQYVIHDLRRLWDEVEGFARNLGFTPPRATAVDVDMLIRELAEPGPFLTLINLDASPQNSVLVDGSGARIVDFEGSGMRHLALDACMLRFPFPNYGHWSVLPEEVRSSMEDAYRESLVDGGVRAAEEDVAYDRAMAVGCASTVVQRIHRLPRIADDDEQALRRRTQMVSAIEVFTSAARRAGVFPALAAWFAGLADEMRARWREANERPREFPALPLPEVATT